MDVLVVGSGGREHAIVHALNKSSGVDKLHCAPGNAGISALADCHDVKATDLPGMVALAKELSVGFVVVAPDDPLALGMVDALEGAGIPAFGPTKAAARIEASKVFSKNLMEQYNIPTARYETFNDPAEALAFVHIMGAPIVVKADGLALGKGVTVARTLEAAEEAIRTIMEDRAFGEAGGQVVIEECMSGPEVTVLCFADEENIVPMPVSQDHKRVYDGDEGPNTGGMGVICPPACYTSEIAERVNREILLPVMAAMKAEGHPYRGALYAGLMLTPDGPRVIEFNARFGDPEAQAVLPLLKSDLLEVMFACRDGTLGDVHIEWDGRASCTVALASGGYPGKYETGLPISGLEEASVLPGVTVYHAGTRHGPDGKFLTAGGRVLGITALGGNLGEATALAYAAAGKISFPGVHMRRDIGLHSAG